MITRVNVLVLVAIPLASAQDNARDPLFFGSKVYPVMEAAQCRSCHSVDGVASGTRLHFPEPDAAPERIQAFGLSLADLIDRSDPEKSLLLNKPTKRVPHTGGERIKPGSGEDKTLSAWTHYLAEVPADTVTAARLKLNEAVAGSRPEQVVRRLTHSQYNNTVRDLLSDYSKPADRFPP